MAHMRPIDTTPFQQNIKELGNMFGNTNVLQGWVQSAVHDATECDIRYALRNAMRLGVAFRALREQVQNDRSRKGTAHTNALSVVTKLQQNALREIVTAFENNCSPMLPKDIYDSQFTPNEAPGHISRHEEDFWFNEPIK